MKISQTTRRPTYTGKPTSGDAPKGPVMHSNCTTTPEKKVVSYSPYRVGWNLWES